MAPAVTGKIGPAINQDQQFACAFLTPPENLIKIPCLSPLKHLQLKSCLQVFPPPANMRRCAPAGHALIISPNSPVTLMRSHLREPEHSSASISNLSLASLPSWCKVPGVADHPDFGLGPQYFTYIPWNSDHIQPKELVWLLLAVIPAWVYRCCRY